MDENLRSAALALQVIVTHQRTLKGTIAFDQLVWTTAYTALNRLGYLDKPIPSQSDAASKHG